MKKGGQLWLLALVSTVLGISWIEGEHRKLLTSGHCESAFAGSTYLPPFHPPRSTYYLIIVFPLGNQKATVRWSSRRFESSSTKGGQVALLALISTVLGVGWKEAEEGKLSW